MSVRPSANPGDSVNVTLERDVAPRTIDPPSELLAVLEKSRQASDSHGARC